MNRDHNDPKMWVNMTAAINAEPRATPRERVLKCTVGNDRSSRSSIIDQYISEHGADGLDEQDASPRKI